MNNYLREIIEKLNKEFKINDIKIVDNSYKHKSHKSYT